MVIDRETVIAEFRLHVVRSSVRRSVSFRLRQHRAGEHAGSATDRYSHIGQNADFPSSAVRREYRNGA